MNTKKSGLHIGYLISIAASSLLFTDAPARAMSITLNPSDFNNNEGSVINNASPSSTVNTSSFGTSTTSPFDDRLGFGNHFSTNFLLLGVNDASNTITSDTKRNGNSVALSNTSKYINIDSDEISNGINVSFNWAFNGNSKGSSSDKDNFTVALVDSNGDENPILMSRLAPSYEQNTSSLFIPGSSLSTGNYRIKITLNENSDGIPVSLGRSTAAGFNNIQIATIIPPTTTPESSPLLGLSIMSGLLYLSHYLKCSKSLTRS